MLADVVNKYLKIFPEDKPKLELLLDQLKNNEALDDRRNFRGHIAGDAVILSPDYKKILLIYHNTYKRWQQPGGHFDPGEAGPWLSAAREAEEETGLSELQRINIADDFRIPIHITTGFVPASEAKNEAEHWHHDFRYGFVAQSEDLPEIEDEGVGGAKWLPLDGYKSEGSHDFDISLRRIIKLVRLKA